MDLIDVIDELIDMRERLYKLTMNELRTEFNEINNKDKLLKEVIDHLEKERLEAKEASFFDHLTKEPWVKK